ncbi:polyubiquitin-like protein [Pseudomonas phage vB_PaeM_PA5oct]|uniref:Polyubiquitin-like protein n=1 Tax=Pseudomonas phage vB_PaeM_PA5oct TaxID=2163605 RepID=A0A4Y5JVW7_9CAUD|nr:polyubiquitin-like protein [Pseudomonas phage vB_PaeM_PA5oct]QCG76162.1 polyubiquitin-like protein [Pseudomonas phage vB_PaeM_PA5oct]BDR25765.1 hypothetical protein RVBP16_2050 [Pseudomonas phage sp. 30-2]
MKVLVTEDSTIIPLNTIAEVKYQKSTEEYVVSFISGKIRIEILTKYGRTHIVNLRDQSNIDASFATASDEIIYKKFLDSWILSLKP